MISGVGPSAPVKQSVPALASITAHIAVAKLTTLPNILTRSSLTAAAKSARLFRSLYRSFKKFYSFDKRFSFFLFISRS